ncbi:MAG TPA: PAS domain-containing protein, partial [Coleofasciculaceae cyanobacterium]
VMLLYFIKKRSDVPFSNIFTLFGAFILLCGTGHLLEILTLWYPAYWVSGIEKALTALVSCYTAFRLVELLPQFLALKTPESLAQINQQLQIEITERQRTESVLHHAYDQLEQRVEERTVELVQANLALGKEIQERVAIESALRRSEATHRALLNAIPDLIIRTTRDGVYLDVKPAKGFPGLGIQGDWSGQQISELLPVELCQQQLHGIEQALQTQEPQIYEQEIQVNAKTQVEEVRIVPCEDDEVLVIVRDITQRRQVEETLRENRQILEMVMNNTPQAIFWKDQNLNYLGCNPRFARDAGLNSPAEIVGKSDYMLPSSHEEAESYRRCDRQIIESGESQLHIIETLRLSDGKQIWVEKTKVPLRNAKGTVIGVLGTYEDVTERKQFELTLRQVAERERATARIIQQMRQSLQLESIFAATTQELRQATNCDRVIVYRFNPDWSGDIIAEAVAAGWISLLAEQHAHPSWTENVIQGDRCTVKLISDASNLLEDTYLKNTQGGIYREGIEYLPVADIYAAEFTPCYIELLEQLQARAYLIVPIFCGNQLWGLLSAYQNDAPRHWEETEIRMVVQIGNQLGVAIQQAQLLSQTQQQAEELKAAKEAADAANRAKSEFLANMSHELRTPLNAILGFTQIMNRDDSLPSRYQQHVSIINRSGEHLLELINDILEMSKIEAGRIALCEEDFDFHQFLSTLEDMLQLIAVSKGLQFVVQQDPNVPRYIRTDQGKLRQILINLLGNAIKFTDEGQVTLRVQTLPDQFAAAPQADPSPLDAIHTLYFAVEDTGPGIAPEEMKDLFIAFKQTQVGMKSGQGTGLGLPISQRCVRLMGGEITVESIVGQGTTFSFNIPVQLAQLGWKVSQQQQVVGLAPNQPAYRILVVDDNLNSRLLITNLLSPLGFEVEVATDGLEAVARWETWRPHLIWMDMRMP